MPIKEIQSSIKINPNVDLSKKSIVKYQCPYCKKTYRQKFTYNRHHKRGCKKKPEGAVDTPEAERVGEEVKEEEVVEGKESEQKVEEKPADEDKTVDELREEVLVLYRNDPASLITECDNEVIKHVNKMSRGDLKLKIAQKRLLIGAKLNGTMTNTVLLTANKIVGGMMKCQEGLNNTTMQDDILKESCDDLLSYYLLDSIPVTVRLAILYGSHVVTNTYEAKKERDNEVIIIPPEKIEVMPDKKVIPEKGSLKKEFSKLFKKKPIKYIGDEEEEEDDHLPKRYSEAQGMISDM